MLKHKIVLVIGLVLGMAMNTAGQTKPVNFAKQILPILSNKCFICHGPDTRNKKDLRLDSYEGATKDLGGYQAINPKNPQDSELIARIHDKDDPMPPEDAEKHLTDEERKLLTAWVKQGGKYTKHWAFVKPKKQAIPVEHKQENPIDAFILEQLKEKAVGFASEADRATLARRASLVLIGLPPELKDLDAFLNDKRADAYERFIEKLLSNPKFGEHQARYWLDAIRYGDTHGLHLDNKRGIYPYRDWVVKAFNDNLPLNDFITWQLAGDLLPNPTLEQQVATGFVRMNPTTAEGGAIPAEFQAKNNFDRTENLGTVLLGMTMICSRCHTHKYDPITQQEYFELFAFFNNTAEHSMDGNKYTYGPIVNAPKNQEAWTQWEQFEKETKTLVGKLKQHPPAQWSDQEKKIWENASDRDRLNQLGNPKGPYVTSKLHGDAVELLKRITEAEKQYTTTLVAKELPKPRKTQILSRGEYNLPIGEPLQPGILKVMGSFPADAPRNRLGLAQWLTSKEHPLVSRVLINRIWLRTFGEALVRTPEDFGLQGQQPTHPELLDYLAVELQDSGWNLKQMLRLMVTSKTFKQSSAWRKDVNDPENKLFSRGPSYRLDAEVLRDLALWSSDMLDPVMGGEGVKPYQPAGMWMALAHPGSNTKQYQRDKGQRLYRRSLYVYWKRTSPHPMMTIFDAPSRETSCVRRSRTNTALQSLGLLNETQRVELSRKLAERLLKEAKDDAGRISLLFKLLGSREPTPQEYKVCSDLLTQMKKRYTGDIKAAEALLTTGEAPSDKSLNAIEVASWTQVAVTVLASDIAILLY